MELKVQGTASCRYSKALLSIAEHKGNEEIHETSKNGDAIVLVTEYWHVYFLEVFEEVYKILIDFQPRAKSHILPIHRFPRYVFQVVSQCKRYKRDFPVDRMVQWDMLCIWYRAAHVKCLVFQIVFSIVGQKLCRSLHCLVKKILSCSICTLSSPVCGNVLQEFAYSADCLEKLSF